MLGTEAIAKYELSVSENNGTDGLADGAYSAHQSAGNLKFLFELPGGQHCAKLKSIINPTTMHVRTSTKKAASCYY